MSILQPQARIRFFMLGGFLGAGKTTALLRLAHFYSDQGKRVGIITNDQAEGLVDTLTFRGAGFRTEEIPSGCFCCHFDQLLEASGRLEDGYHPDIILAEPVGSCTDLVNAVVTPLRNLYGDRFDVAPYAVVLDPARAMEALAGDGPSSFSSRVTYIFKMQQNEADIVLLNKVDLLSPTKQDQIMALVRQNFPKAVHLPFSARTGEGFPALMELLDKEISAGANPAAVDYAIYAEGEAALGWLNARVVLEGKGVWDGNAALSALAIRIHTSLVKSGAEIAHFKMHLQNEARHMAAVHTTSNAQGYEVTGRLDSLLNHGELVINLRAEARPEDLELTVREAVGAVANSFNLDHTIWSLNAFSPAAPVPPPPDRNQIRS